MSLIPPALVVDTREQAPWEPRVWRDQRWLLLPVVRRALVAGDYTIEGCAQEIAIERKSLADWIGTLFGSITDAGGEKMANFDRFRREVLRATGGVQPEDGSQPTPPLQLFAVVVEASIDQIAGGQYRSRVLPQSVLGRSWSLWADYGIPVFFAGDRGMAQHWATWTLLRWWERKQRARGATSADIARALEAADAEARRGQPEAGMPRGMRPIGEQMGVKSEAERRAMKRRPAGARS